MRAIFAVNLKTLLDKRKDNYGILNEFVEFLRNLVKILEEFCGKFKKKTVAQEVRQKCDISEPLPCLRHGLWVTV